MPVLYLAIGAKQIDQVENLMAFLVHAGGGALTGDCDNRGAVHIGVGKAGDQVGCTRPKGRQAYPRVAGQASVDVGHKRGALFVAGGDKLQIAVNQRIHHIDIFFAGNTENVLDLFVFKTFDKQF